MEQLFITNLEIKKVRHLNNISIPLAENQIKHLILTGKNGSGKTSVVEALAGYLNNVFIDQYFWDKEQWLKNARYQLDEAIRVQSGEAQIAQLEKEVCQKEKDIEQSRKGLHINYK